MSEVVVRSRGVPRQPFQVATCACCKSELERGLESNVLIAPALACPVCQFNIPHTDIQVQWRDVA